MAGELRQGRLVVVHGQPHDDVLSPGGDVPPQPGSGIGCRPGEHGLNGCGQKRQRVGTLTCDRAVACPHRIEAQFFCAVRQPQEQTGFVVLEHDPVPRGQQEAGLQVIHTSSLDLYFLFLK